MIEDLILYPRLQRLVIPKLTNIVRGQQDLPYEDKKPCLVQLDDICRDERDTVVWCHSNLQIHGKGLGKKSHDCFGFFGCYRCHQELDHGTRLNREEKETAARLAMDRSLLYLWTHNLIGVIG